MSLIRCIEIVEGNKMGHRSIRFLLKNAVLIRFLQRNRIQYMQEDLLSVFAGSKARVSTMAVCVLESQKVQ